MITRKFLPIILVISAIFFSANNSTAQQGNAQHQHQQSAQGKAMAGGCGMQGQVSGQAMACCQGMMGEMRSDMMIIHTLLDNRDKIRRTFKEIPNGIESRTESDDPKLVPILQEHLVAMERRLKEGRPIHQMDPLFRDIFANASRIEMKIENTPKGVQVIETSTDPNVVALIRQHAKKVDSFVKEGRPAAMGMMGCGCCMQK